MPLGQLQCQSRGNHALPPWASIYSDRAHSLGYTLNRTNLRTGSLEYLRGGCGSARLYYARRPIHIFRACLRANLAACCSGPARGIPVSCLGVAGVCTISPGLPAAIVPTSPVTGPTFSLFMYTKSVFSPGQRGRAYTVFWNRRGQPAGVCVRFLALWNVPGFAFRGASTLSVSQLKMNSSTALSCKAATASKSGTKYFLGSRLH